MTGLPKLPTKPPALLRALLWRNDMEELKPWWTSKAIWTGLIGSAWGVAGTLVWAWVLTIPCSAFVAAVAWWIGTLIL